MTFSLQILQELQNFVFYHWYTKNTSVDLWVWKTPSKIIQFAYSHKNTQFAGGKDFKQDNCNIFKSPPSWATYVWYSFSVSFMTFLIWKILHYTISRWCGNTFNSQDRSTTHLYSHVYGKTKAGFVKATVQYDQDLQSTLSHMSNRVCIPHSCD